jgi:hypothetical protein
MMDAEPSANSVDTGDYFERLDQAFANMTAETDFDRPAGGSATALDWFESQSAPSQAAGTPFNAPARPYEPPPTGTFGGRSENWDQPTIAPSPPPVVYSYAPAPVPPPPPLPSLPPLADAFAALLAAEEVSPAPRSAPVWPSTAQPVSAPSITDDVIEDITRRVMDRLTDRVLSDSIEEKVSQIAERLIREEIERIKRSIT